MIQELLQQFNLYQSLNISICNTSFFPSETTWGIFLTTDSLYNHVDLRRLLQREVSWFLKGLGPARFSRAEPSETPAVWLGSRLRLGTGLQLSVTTNWRAAGISWLEFSAVVFSEAGFGDRTQINLNASVGKHTKKIKKQPQTRHIFLFRFLLTLH